ncbi:uncharacterized protein [Narcine bancroftii]|uniref:uncharacterized protein n=1 Tax=Narcine bancroftii TaxID=1343680 RepID=UPI0038320E7F
MGVGVSCRPVWLQQVRSYPFVASAAAVRPNKETSTQVLWMQSIPLCTEWNVYKFHQDLVLERLKPVYFECPHSASGPEQKDQSYPCIACLPVSAIGLVSHMEPHNLDDLELPSSWASGSITNGDKGQPCLVECVKLNVSEICPFVTILTKGFLYKALNQPDLALLLARPQAKQIDDILRHWMRRGCGCFFQLLPSSTLRIRIYL